VKWSIAGAGLALTLACGCARAGDAAPPSAQKLAAGERAFEKCYACHSVDPAETGTEGPLLRGVVGRKVAALPGYAYSPAMQAYGTDGKTWTRERLDAFIANPPGVVPQTAMNFFGVPDAQERTALIAWLAKQR
jgi:cytochrome c2